MYAVQCIRCKCFIFIFILIKRTLVPCESLAASAAGTPPLTKGLSGEADSAVLMFTFCEGAKGTPMRLSLAELLVVYVEIFSMEFSPPLCLQEKTKTKITLVETKN